MNARTPPPPADSPRYLHEWYAKANGYFWLPCPLCGEPFGGHEWGHEAAASIPVPGKPHMFRGVCKACAAERRGTAS